MKMPISWHKENLKNWHLSLERKKKQLEQLRVEVDRDLKEATFYHVQINEAILKSKDGFDSELFMKKEKRHHVL